MHGVPQDTHTKSNSRSYPSIDRLQKTPTATIALKSPVKPALQLQEKQQLQLTQHHPGTIQQWPHQRTLRSIRLLEHNMLLVLLLRLLA